MAVSFFATLGNSQDAVVTSAPPTGYGVQGNAAWTQSQHDAELRNAALAARQKKEMMNSMAAVGMQTPTFTSAEQYLQFYKPTVTANTGASGAGTPPVRRDAYVPEFETGPTTKVRSEAPAPPEVAPVATAPSAPPTDRTDLPAKRGLFNFLKGKEASQVDAALLPAPPASAYPETPVGSTDAPPAPAAAPVEPASAPTEAVTMATVGSGEKPSLLGKLFRRSKETEPSFAPDPTLSDPTSSRPAAAEMTSQSEGSSDGVGIPSPPGFNAPPAPKPEETVSRPALPEPKPEPPVSRPAPPAPKPEPPVSRPAPPAPKPEQPVSRPAPPAPQPEAPAPKPAPPAPATPAAPAPMPGSSIFVERPTFRSLGVAIVMEEVQANVDGVLVRLYEGNRVELLDRQGSIAKVRLLDGREGTVPANSLGQ